MRRRVAVAPGGLVFPTGGPGCKGSVCHTIRNPEGFDDAVCPPGAGSTGSSKAGKAEAADDGRRSKTACLRAGGDVGCRGRRRKSWRSRKRRHQAAGHPLQNGQRRIAGHSATGSRFYERSSRREGDERVLQAACHGQMIVPRKAVLGPFKRNRNAGTAEAACTAHQQQAFLRLT